MRSSSSSIDIEKLWALLQDRLAGPGYSDAYATESAFEDDVWARIIGLAAEIGLSPDKACLTSHVDRAARSIPEWQKFCAEAKGPDVEIMGSKNRLDIVVKAAGGSIGLEVKCLGTKGHAAKVTQGLGQAVLALTNRDRTILMIHAGSVSVEWREQLRSTGEDISRGTRTALIVVP